MCRQISFKSVTSKLVNFVVDFWSLDEDASVTRSISFKRLAAAIRMPRSPLCNKDRAGIAAVHSSYAFIVFDVVVIFFALDNIRFRAMKLVVVVSLCKRIMDSKTTVYGDTASPDRLWIFVIKDRNFESAMHDHNWIDSVDAISVNRMGMRSASKSGSNIFQLATKQAFMASTSSFAKISSPVHFRNWFIHSTKERSAFILRCSIHSVVFKAVSSRNVPSNASMTLNSHFRRNSTINCRISSFSLTLIITFSRCSNRFMNGSQSITFESTLPRMDEEASSSPNKIGIENATCWTIVAL